MKALVRNDYYETSVAKVEDCIGMSSKSQSTLQLLKARRGRNGSKCTALLICRVVFVSAFDALCEAVCVTECEG